MTDASVLSIEGVTIAYRTHGRLHTAVVDADLEVRPRETVALIGQSGSGKSTLAGAALGLLPAHARVVAGSIALLGEDVGRPRTRRRLLRSVGYVPQDPAASLNPVRTVRSQLRETIRAKRIARPEEDIEGIVTTALRDSGIADPASVLARYPHELSGGLLQRVLIANAIVSRPRLIIADEPTSALDVTTQKEILDTLDELRHSLGMSVLLVTHDLSIAADRTDRVVVMNDGRVVETGRTTSVLERPRHPYTAALLRDVPDSIDVSLAQKRPLRGTEVPHLEVRHLVKRFGSLVAVDDVSFTVKTGTTHALVGESGSGKTTVSRTLLGLTPATSGEVVIRGERVDYADRRALARLRRNLQIVYQNPYGSLDPEFTVTRIIAEPLARFGVGDRRERRGRVLELLDAVGLAASAAGKPPADLSGGQRQRVAIARALAVNPDLLVLDEPTSALDVSVQAQILELIRDLQRSHGLTYLFVSHDLRVVAELADTVTVMRRGVVVESGSVTDVLSRPQDPYTRRLLAAVPGRA